MCKIFGLLYSWEKMLSYLVDKLEVKVGILPFKQYSIWPLITTALLFPTMLKSKSSACVCSGSFVVLFCFVVYYMITEGSLETSETKIYQNVFCWAHFICSERVNFPRTESSLLICYLTYYPKVARYMTTIQNANYMGLEGWLYD